MQLLLNARYVWDSRDFEQRLLWLDFTVFCTIFNENFLVNLKCKVAFDPETEVPGFSGYL
jgi:hypothetical protein